MTKSREKRVLAGVREAISSVAELVTKNFWLKVLSLAIAVVIYLVLRPEAEEKPILPYVGVGIEKPWSAPAHSVVIESEKSPAKSAKPPQPKPIQPSSGGTNDTQSAVSGPKGNNDKNDGKRQ